MVGTAREAAQASDITFAMLADPQAALDVAQGPDGAVAGGACQGAGFRAVLTVRLSMLIVVHQAAEVFHKLMSVCAAVAVLS